MLQTTEIEQIWKPFHLKKMAFEQNTALKSVILPFAFKKHQPSLEMLMLRDDDLNLKEMCSEH